MSEEVLLKEKRKLTRNEKSAIIIIIVAAIVAAIIFVGVSYVNDYYRATEKALTAIMGDAMVEVTEEDGYYLFQKRPNIAYVGNGIGKGIIFYPGGKVDEVAYAPLLQKLAREGYTVYLVKMPAKLAIFGMNAADDILAANSTSGTGDDSEITEWIMMGHSLGGAMAASYTASHSDKISGLVLLAAYSTEDLKGLDVDVYSFYGSEDKVLNMEKYKEYYGNLPEDMVEVVIDGGNHSYYAHYGEQEGDGTAIITREEQQETVLDILINLRP